MAKSEHLKSRASFKNRYRLTKVYLDTTVVKDRRRYGTWVKPDIDMTSYDRYAVREVDENRPDLIAYKFYNDPTLWWVICQVNGLSHPFDDLTVGLVLKIPKIDNIASAFAGVTSE